MRNMIVVAIAVVTTLVLFNEPLGFEIPVGFAHALSFNSDWAMGLNR
jgi:hypothetical protein